MNRKMKIGLITACLMAAIVSAVIVYAAGDVLPITGSIQNLGSAAKPWGQLYVGTQTVQNATATNINIALEMEAETGHFRGSQTTDVGIVTVTLDASGEIEAQSFNAVGGLTTVVFVASGNAQVLSLDVTGNATNSGALDVEGELEALSLHVTGITTNDGAATITGGLTASTIDASGEVEALSLHVTGASTNDGAFTVGLGFTQSSTAEDTTIASTNFILTGLPSVPPAASGALWIDANTNLCIVP